MNNETDNIDLSHKSQLIQPAIQCKSNKKIQHELMEKCAAARKTKLEAAYADEAAKAVGAA